VLAQPTEGASERARGKSPLIQAASPPDGSPAFGGAKAPPARRLMVRRRNADPELQKLEYSAHGKSGENPLTTIFLLTK
jgi:hypothetical protein